MIAADFIVFHFPLIQLLVAPDQGSPPVIRQSFCIHKCSENLDPREQIQVEADPHP